MNEFGPKYRPDVPKRVLPEEPHSIGERDSQLTDKKTKRQSRIRGQQPETEGRTIRLNPSETTYLVRIAQGDKRKNVAVELGISLTSVGRVTDAIHLKLGTETAVAAILTALDRRLIPTQPILNGFDRNSLKTLRPQEIVLLEKLIENNGKETTNPNLAAQRKQTSKAVEGRLIRLYRKLGTKNKERTAAVYAATKLSYFPQTSSPTIETPERQVDKPQLAPRQVDFLTLVALGLKRPEIGEHFEVSVAAIDKIATAINKKLGTRSTVNAILTALDHDLISSTILLNGFDTNLLARLSEQQRNTLDTLIKNNGRERTNAAIGRRLGKASDTIENVFSAIYSKLGTINKERTAAVYAAAKKL